jgi:hypothetical protein
MKKIFLAPAFLALGACGIFSSDNEEIIFDTTLGPETKLQIADLDEGLASDSANARYLPEERRGNNLESEDGSD